MQLPSPGSAFCGQPVRTRSQNGSLCRNSGPIMPLSGWVAIRGCVSPEEQVSEVCSISRSDE